MAPRIIVFGPTGNVASVAAITAQSLGAKVFLAMRDVKKAIPGLDAAEERECGFEKVHADLTKLDTIADAVKKTNTSTAFIYCAHQADDHMKSALQTLKASGITFVVVLSSFTITKPLRDIVATDHIPYIHAQVEINLEDIYGTDAYVAIRGGAFATNTLWWKDGLKKGKVVLEGPDVKLDWVSAEDMGRVAGRILVEGQRNKQHAVYTYGPQLVSRREVLALVAAAAGRTLVEVKEDSPAPEEDNARTILYETKPEARGGEWFKDAYLNHDEGVQNVVTYSGKPPMDIASWVKDNIPRFDL